MSRKPNEYPGETDAKRLARLAVYRRVEELQPASIRGKFKSVVLAGPEAGEIGCLRHFLGLEPPLVYFVDEKKEGLTRAQEKWPDVNTLHGNILQLPSDVTPLAFLHLDFCGYVTPERLSIVRKLSYRLANWGMVFYTFFRGREHSARMAKMKKAKAETLEGKRFALNTQLLWEALGKFFTPVFSLQYTGVQYEGGKRTLSGNHMGILGFQKLPPGNHMGRTWLKMVESPSPYGGKVPGDKRLLEQHLRVEALSLRTRGLNSTQVAEVLNMSQGTVAAWFAIESRQ